MLAHDANTPVARGTPRKWQRRQPEVRAGSQPAHPGGGTMEADMMTTSTPLGGDGHSSHSAYMGDYETKLDHKKYTQDDNKHTPRGRRPCAHR
eukprot:6469433-Amphidinium_carterae.6